VKDAAIPLMTANAYVHIVANLKVANVALVMTKRQADRNQFALSILVGETSWWWKKLIGWQADRKEAV
jgi:hypothetical protein